MKEIELVLVEDDPMVMSINEEFINKVGGFKITGTASSGRRALVLLQELRPRLTVLDIYLPDLDGLQVLRTIRQKQIPTDVILITAVHDVPTVQEFLRLGVIDYIIKPFKFERIRTALLNYREYVDKLAGCAALDQSELDSLLTRTGVDGQRGTTPDDDLPKGLREVTLRQVLTFLESKQLQVSAEEVAEGVGLARVTARRYLEYLEGTGKVLLTTRYGSIGRPVNMYKFQKR